MVYSATNSSARNAEAQLLRNKEDIGRLILESVDDVLDGIFGKPMRQTFYDLLERNYHIGRDDIPNQIDTFLLILERKFGKNAKAVRRDIAQKITQNLVANTNLLSRLSSLEIANASSSWNSAD